jgi:hypothetical protein
MVDLRRWASVRGDIMGKLAPKQIQPSTKETTPESKQKGFLGFLKRKPVRSSIWVFNSLWGAFAVVVGSHDLLSPRAAERTTGAVFFIGGLALTMSAIWTLRSQNGTGQTNGKKMNYALGGVILGLLPGTTLIIIQLDYYGYSRRVVFWLLAVAIPALGAIILWNKGARPAFFRAPSSVAILAAIIALLPTLLGGAFRSVVDATYVDAQMNMHVVGHRVDSKLGNVAVIECKLTIKNIGKRRLIVVGSLYSVRAYNIRQRKSPKKADWPVGEGWPMGSELSDQHWSGRYESPSDKTTVDEVGYDIFSPGDTLEPGQQIVFTLLPVVPYDQYDVVDAYATVATALDDRLRLGAQKTKVEDQTLNRYTPVKAIWDIEPTSYVVWLTQGSQELRVAYGMYSWRNKFDGLYLELGTGRHLQTQQTSGKYNPRAFTAYGLGLTTADDFVILDATSP